MIEDAYEAVRGMATCLAVVIGIVAGCGWCYYWVGPHHDAFEHAAQKKWPITMATVTKAGNIQGNEAVSAYRSVAMSFRDRQGHLQVMEKLMPWQYHVGQRTPIVIGPKNGIYAYNEVGGTGEETNPRHPEDNVGPVMIAVFPIPIFFGVMVGVASFWAIVVLLIAIGLLIAFLWRLFTQPALMRLARRRVRLAIRKVADELKLRWEFRRRRKRLRATAAYKSVRRFQAELGRMDPTPRVHDARRKANELLTAVLDRDNTRLEVINGTIDEIRNDVDLDTRARQEAHEELQTERA